MRHILRQDNMITHLPATGKGQKYDLKKWPKVSSLSQRNFIESLTFNSEAINNLKSSEPYQYFHGNKVGHVLPKEVEQDLVCCKADRAKSDPQSPTALS